MSNHLKKPAVVFLIGISAGILCRLSDLFPYESLWSLSSVATLLGFWIASVSVITMYSTSHKVAFTNAFLYLFGMTLAFYALKYLLGLFALQFDNDGVFQTRLFWVYTGLSLLCGLGSVHSNRVPCCLSELGHILKRNVMEETFYEI